MKHPVLARMLSVMLVVVCLIMLIAGVTGREEAEESFAEAQREHEKLLGRIETYRSLEAALEGETPYSEANAEYIKRKAQYDRDISRHNSDIATHATTQGGYEMGADAMWDYRAQLVDAQYSLETLLSQAQLQYGSLTESETIAAQSRAMAELCRGAAALVGDTPAMSEPVPPTPPTMPEPPSFTAPQPQRGDYPEGAEGESSAVSLPVTVTEFPFTSFPTIRTLLVVLLISLRRIPSLPYSASCIRGITMGESETTVSALR